MAGKSTLNRLELSRSEPSRYHKIAYDAAAIEALPTRLFLEAHKRPSAQIILDLHATDDPLHGHQEGRFLHGYYDCYCYLPLYVFCGRHLLAAKLRPSDIDASAGSVAEVERIIRQIRARWPFVRIVLRADSGFAREALMAWCEQNRVDYLFGLARNTRLVAMIEEELATARAAAEKTGRPARRFKDFQWSTLGTWSRRRRVVAKAEWTKGEANPRFVVTSLKQAEAGARGHVTRRLAETAKARAAPALSCDALNRRHHQQGPTETLKAKSPPAPPAPRLLVAFARPSYPPSHSYWPCEKYGLALLWQIYSRRCSLQIHFRQCGHRCGGGRMISSRMA